MDKDKVNTDLMVLLSLMEEKELFKLRDGIDFLIKNEVYESNNYPLSCGGLRVMEAHIRYELAFRTGKAIKVVEGEIVICEQIDSPFTMDDWRVEKKYVEPEPAEDVYPMMEAEEPKLEKEGEMV